MGRACSQLVMVLVLLAWVGSATAAEPVSRDPIKAFCIDFNWAEKDVAPPGMFAQASPQQHVEWYAALGVNTIQTFCVSCPGYAWYRSSIAPVQPGMKGDFLKEITALGHARGMRVMGYFCIGPNTYWSEQHPDEVHPLPGAISIPFTRKYLEYLSRIIPEAITATGIDGFMIDWVFNASHFYPDKEYTWLACEKEMYQELYGEPFPGDEAMTSEKISDFNRRALDRCWDTIKTATRKTKPDCIIWLTCYNLQDPQVVGSRILKEVDWIMNEHPDPEKLAQARSAVGPQCKLIQCICGWGDQHNAAKILSDPQYADLGFYGFAKADPVTTLPPEGTTGNAKNIASIRAAFTGTPSGDLK